MRLIRTGLMTAVCLALAGCSFTIGFNNGWSLGLPTTVETTVFELDAPMAEVLPELTSFAIPDGPYRVAYPTGSAYQTLLARQATDTEILSDTTRVAYGGAGSDLFGYSRVWPRLMVSGNASGTLGGRWRDGVWEVHVAYDIEHSVRVTDPDCPEVRLAAHVDVEGTLPAGRSILLLYAPYTRGDGHARAHLIAFQFSR